MKKIAKVLLSTLISIVSLTALGIPLGYLLPINTLTPYWILLSRSTLKGKCDNLLIGNKHVYYLSPFFNHLGTKAWNEFDMVYGLKSLENEAKENEIFYSSYSQEEIASDSTKKDVSYYAFKNHNSEPKPFIITIAGGGFTSVCTFSESLPVSAKISELGYPTFCLTYRVGSTFGILEDETKLMDDIAKSIEDIIARKDEFNIDPNNYYVTGFSAGAMTASLWCDRDKGYTKYNLPRPKGCGLIYGYSLDSVLKEDYVPTYSLFCKNDQYFSLDDYQKMNDSFNENNIIHESKVVDCLHGFGLGSNTEAEGWVEDYIKFCEKL